MRSIWRRRSKTAIRKSSRPPLARETSLTREGLYKAFGGNGNPSFATVMKVARALGVNLTAQSA